MNGSPRSSSAGSDMCGAEEPNFKRNVRLDRILKYWPDLQDAIRKMPAAEEAAALWKKTGAPLSHRDIGKTDQELCDAFVFSPEVRDRYVGSCLIRDLGLTEEAKEWILE